MHLPRSRQKSEPPPATPDCVRKRISARVAAGRRVRGAEWVSFRDGRRSALWRENAGCLTSGAKARAFFALDGASKAAPFQSRAEALCQKRVWRRTMSAGRLSEGSFVKRPSETAICQTLRREGGGCS